MAQDLVTITGLWVAALFTLFTFSFIYKENRLYRFAEHTVVGASAGHYSVIAYQSILDKGWYPLVSGQYLYLLPMILGFLIFSRFTKKYGWTSFYPVALLVGLGTGLAVRGTVQAEFLAQITSTVRPLYIYGYETLNNIIITVTVISVLVYFLFTVEPKGLLKSPVSYVGKLGRYLLMVAFGAQFGAAIMTRIAMLIQRFQFLLFEWLGL